MTSDGAALNPRRSFNLLTLACCSEHRSNYACVSTTILQPVLDVVDDLEGGFRRVGKHPPTLLCPIDICSQRAWLPVAPISSSPSHRELNAHAANWNGTCLDQWERRPASLRTPTDVLGYASLVNMCTSVQHMEVQQLGLLQPGTPALSARLAPPTGVGSH